MNWFILERKGVWVGVIAQENILTRVVLADTAEDIFTRMGVKNKVSCLTYFLRKVKDTLIDYFAGNKVDLSSYPLRMNVSKMAGKVLFQVKKIPYGQVRTYKWVAEQSGTRGYRAVGRILSMNPLPIFIPCHRVVRVDGSLGGFSAGIELKRKLLEIEGIYEPVS